MTEALQPSLSSYLSLDLPPLPPRGCSCFPLNPSCCSWSPRPQGSCGDTLVLCPCGCEMLRASLYVCVSCAVGLCSQRHQVEWLS